MTSPVDGAQGSEKKFYSPIANEILEDYQVEQQREWLASTPRNLAKFNKTLVSVTETWTWKKQSSRFSPDGFTFVKIDVKYLTADGKEL